MKKTLLILSLCLATLSSAVVQAEITLPVKNEVESSKKNPSSGEKIFVENASECLAKMENAAKEMSITGVAMIAYIPGEKSETWISTMKVVGKLATNDVNYLAVAYAKASEMAVTLKNSGNETRKDIIGETGWQGGAILKVDSGYLIAAFSGGTGQEDVDVSTIGLEWLGEFF